MNAQNSLSRIVVVLAAVSLVAGCGSKPVVGVLLPTSGSAASYGESMKRGIDMAIEEAQADGSYPVSMELVWGDSGSEPESAVRELRRLAGDGARLVIVGTTSGSAKALLPVLEETQTVALSPSASLPSLTRDSKLFYRVFASDELEGRRAGRFLREEQQASSCLIFSEDSEQARGIEPPFRQVFEQALDGDVVGKVLIAGESWQREASDLLAAHTPDAVYIIAYAEKTIEVLALLREAAYEGVICATSAFYSGELIEKTPELVEGVFFPQPAFDTRSDIPLVKEFVAAYRLKYATEPDIYAAHAYDAVRVAMFVASTVGSFSTDAIRKAMLLEVKEFPGVTGIIQFDDYGDVRHNPIMFIIRDGEVRNYERWVAEEKRLILERMKDLLQG